MSIRAKIPAGLAMATVNGLHQWDYGQTLEIEADGLPTLVEVHFACPGMREAAVRVGGLNGSIYSVAIPDECLTQSAPITAWVCDVSGGNCTTILTLVLPIIERTRPAPGDAENITPDLSNQYTEVIEEVNTVVGALRDGTVTAAKAIRADIAAEATATKLVGALRTSGYADFSATVGGVTVEEGLTLLVCTDHTGMYDPDGDYPSLNINGTGAFPVFAGKNRQVGAWWEADDILRLCFRGTYWQVLENITQRIIYMEQGDQEVDVLDPFVTVNRNALLGVGSSEQQVEIYFSYSNLEYGDEKDHTVGGILTLSPERPVLHIPGTFDNFRGELHYDADAEDWTATWVAPGEPEASSTSCVISMRKV